MLINGREEGCVGQTVDSGPSSGLDRIAPMLILQNLTEKTFALSILQTTIP
jgi:hypothetical protein